jgi:hypothetical protein
MMVVLGTGLSYSQVLVVDPLGGGDYTKVQDAVAAAAEGDLILIKDGAYAPSLFDLFLTVDGKSLVLTAEAGATVTLSQFRMTVKNLGPGQFVTLRGIEFMDMVIKLEDNPGTIRLEDCTASGPALDALSQGPLNITDCASVAVVNSTLHGSNGVAYRSSPGARLQQSNVHFYDSTLYGGDDTGSGLGASSALVVDGGEVFLASTSLLGGDGGGTAAGHGLHLQTGMPEATSLGSTFQGGSGTPAGNAVQVDSGFQEVLSELPRTLVASDIAREGETFDLTFTGQPGDKVLLFFSLLPGATYYPNFHGSFLFHLGNFNTVLLGTLPGTGVLPLSSPVPELGGALEGIALYLQASFTSLGGKLTLSNGAAAILLDASL